MKNKLILIMFCFLFINGCHSYSNSENWSSKFDKESTNSSLISISDSNEESSVIGESSTIDNESNSESNSNSIFNSESESSSNEELSSTVENTDSSSGDEWLPDIRPN